MDLYHIVPASRVHPRREGLKLRKPALPLPSNQSPSRGGGGGKEEKKKEEKKEERKDKTEGRASAIT